MQKDGDTYHPEREETYGKVIKKQGIKTDTPALDHITHLKFIVSLLTGPELH